MFSVAAAFDSCLADWPLARLVEGCADVERLGAAAMAQAVARTDRPERPLRDIAVTPREAFLIGGACLSMRARALKQAGPKRFRSFYQRSCADAGLDSLVSRGRRRAMIVTILADEDTLRGEVERSGQAQEPAPGRSQHLLQRPGNVLRY